MIKKEKIETTEITLTELKSQLSLDLTDADEDIYLQTLINVAVSYIEGEINADILETTNTLELDAGDTSIIINEAPFIELVSIKDSDETDVKANFTTTESWNNFMTINLFSSQHYLSNVIFPIRTSPTARAS